MFSINQSRLRNDFSGARIPLKLQGRHQHLTECWKIQAPCEEKKNGQFLAKDEQLKSA